MKATVAPDKIPVVASSDDNYAYPMGAMFASLLANTSQPERFHLFVIDGGISAQKQQQLKDDITRRGSQLTVIDLDSDLYADFPTHAHISKPAYYRISIPELFAEEVQRAIYLDCDLIIKDDLQKLWAMDLAGYALGAVENISKRTYVASQLPQEDYFNSGVLLLDLKKWREQNISERIRRFKREHPELICTNDQCAFNGVFRGDWQRLPLRWNQQSGIYRPTPQLERYRHTGEYQEALWEPAIIHYVGWSKPWLTPCYHPLEGEYRRYSKGCSYGTNYPFPASTPNRRGISLLKKRWRQYRWQKAYLAKDIALFP